MHLYKILISGVLLGGIWTQTVVADDDSASKVSASAVAETRMDPYLRALFASPNDFELINSLYLRILDVEDSADNGSDLPEAYRTVLNIWGATGLIGNGGFTYLLSSDRTEFTEIATAFERIHADQPAKATRNVLALFPDSKPSTDREARMRYLRQLETQAKVVTDASSAVVWRTQRQVLKLLGNYVREHQAEYVKLEPDSSEDLKAIKKKNLAPPPSNSDASTIICWLQSIGAHVSKWSDVQDYHYVQTLPKPENGDPIYEIRLDPNRRTTDTELALLLQYESLKSVRILDLSETFLTIEGARLLPRFPLLAKIDLRETDADDEWLAVLPQLPNLKILGLTRTNVSDQGIAALAKIASLSQLELTLTTIHGRGLASLGKLQHLKCLKLIGCPLSYTAGLSELRYLEQLDLRNTPIGDLALSHISRLTGMRNLGLSSTKISDDGLKSLSQFRHLEILQAECTAISGTAFAQLSSLSKLRELDLYATNVTDATVVHLAAMKSLTQLNLSGTKVSDACFEPLSTLSALTSLGLRGTAIEAGEPVKQLERLKNLESLSISRNVANENRNIIYLKQELPKLRITAY